MLLGSTCAVSDCALRHADAANVVVTYGVWPDAVTVDVVDDGRGFDPARSGDGFGLPGLQVRVDQPSWALSRTRAR